MSENQSGISVQITRDDSSIRAALMGLIAMGENLAPVMRDLAAYGAASTRERFHTETDPDGKPWKKSLRAQMTGGKTLTESGHLGDSIASDSGRDWAAWGSNMIYARIHQLGGTIKPKNAGGMLRFRMAGGKFCSLREVIIPARPYLGVNADDEAGMISLVHRRIRGIAHAG